MYKFISCKTNQLRKSDLNKIIKLKDSFWRFGKFSQLKWFKENIMKNDIHNLLFFKEDLIGYTCLRKKKFIKEKKKINFLLFDTIIIHPNFRKKGLSKILMKKNNSVIKEKKLISILMCSSKLKNFYKKFKWRIESSEKINFIGLNLKKNLIFSFNVNFKFKNLKLLINHEQ